MSNPRCETCKHYKPEPIVKMEGICTDSGKIIYVSDTRQNDSPRVFEFSWCENHEAEA